MPRLHNGDVKLKPAQEASCLKPSDFKKGVETVKKALEEGETRKTRSGTGGFYQGLIRQYQLESLGRTFDAWSEKVETQALSLLDLENTLAKHVRIAIFYWVCNLLKVCLARRPVLLHLIVLVAKRDQPNRSNAFGGR